MAAGDQYLTPKERAKKYSTGVHKASETGARQEAVDHMKNQTRMDIMRQSTSQSDFEGMISGKKRK